MKYRNCEVYDEKDKLIITGIKDFEPKHIFECGQCFRWTREDDNSYTGVVFGKVINVYKNNEELYLKNSSIEDFKNIWFEYFDLGRDYSEIKEKISLDNHMREAIKFGHGIRLLKQDFNEILISFIISANNNIPRIMKSIETLSFFDGREINYNNKKYYEFPQLAAIRDMGVSKVAESKVGFRAKYIVDTAENISNGMFTVDELISLRTIDAKKKLMELKGIGDKVSDCVLLFSGIKYDVFPVDVWVKRVMEELYLKKDTPLKDIHAYGTDYFGNLSGFAQQYLFYYARERRLGNN
jgi:N-glycosylase/DNA lyase